jgi:Raf kinase inhibitor-like YbhB/YbcL family protein
MPRHQTKLVFGALLVFLVGSLFGTMGAQTPASPKAATLVVTSPTLRHGEPVPIVHTPDGRNDSPAVEWKGAPAGTKEFALICEDPGVGNPPPFVHWVIYKIPATAKGLPAALPINGAPMPPEIAGAIQGLSGFRRAIYRGPAPPRGKAHDYHFIVYALDAPLTIDPTQPPLTRAQLLEKIEGHVIGKGELVATYERK